MPTSIAPSVACIASTHSARQPGGLTTVAQRLTALTTGSYAWTWLVRLDQAEGSPTQYDLATAESSRSERDVMIKSVTPDRWAGPLLRRVGWTIFQPGGIRIAPALYGRALRASVDRQLPEDARLVHWVGTGIELLGFELQRQARRRGIPFTVCPALHPGEWGDAAIDARLYAGADAVFALSGDERDRLIAMGVAADRAHVVPLGPSVAAGGDGARFRRQHRLGTDPIVVFLGRRLARKGLPATLAAARRLHDAGHRFSLVVSGPDGEAALGDVGANGVLDIGLADEATKADMIAAADVLCVPSAAESFGIVYLDAWSQGVPVITGEPPAVVGLVDHGVNGLRTDQSVEAVTRALALMLDDPDAGRAMGAAGRDTQRSCYTWQATASAHEQVWSRLR